MDNAAFMDFMRPCYECQRKKPSKARWGLFLEHKGIIIKPKRKNLTFTNKILFSLPGETLYYIVL